MEQGKWFSPRRFTGSQPFTVQRQRSGRAAGAAEELPGRGVSAQRRRRCPGQATALNPPSPAHLRSGRGPTSPRARPAQPGPGSVPPPLRGRTWRERQRGRAALGAALRCAPALTRNRIRRPSHVTARAARGSDTRAHAWAAGAALALPWGRAGLQRRKAVAVRAGPEGPREKLPVAAWLT